MDLEISQRHFNVCLCIGDDKCILERFIDAYISDDIDSKKFTLGYLITYLGETMLWKSKLQKCVVLSLTFLFYV